MAYSATITQRVRPSGVIEIEIREVDAGTATETDSFRLPETFRLISIKADLISGSGATINPSIFWRGGDGTVTTNIYEFGAAAANIDTTPGTGLVIRARQRVGYHRAVCNAGSDNVVRTIYRIMPGWGRV